MMWVLSIRIPLPLPSGVSMSGMAGDTSANTSAGVSTPSARARVGLEPSTRVSDQRTNPTTSACRKGALLSIATAAVRPTSLRGRRFTARALVALWSGEARTFLTPGVRGRVVARVGSRRPVAEVQRAHWRWYICPCSNGGDVRTADAGPDQGPLRAPSFDAMVRRRLARFHEAFHSRRCTSDEDRVGASIARTALVTSLGFHLPALRHPARSDGRALERPRSDAAR